MPDLRQKQPEDSRSKWSKDGARLKATQDSIFDWREVGAQVTWKTQLVEGAAGLFGAGSTGKSAEPEVDLKTLHAKIGELTLENDFLSAALGKAGHPSARR
jgi:hypothetical protein